MRLRGLLTQFHPSLERVLGPRLDHPAVTHLLERFGSPAALHKAGRRQLVNLIRPKAPRMAERLVNDIFDAHDEQTVVVPATATLDPIVPSLARSLAAVHEQRRALEAQISELLEAHPLSQVLTSMPGVGVRTAATLLITIGDGSAFPTAARLASYTGPAPATKSSGSSIHGEHAPRTGNTQALLRLARHRISVIFAMLRDGTFYQPRTPKKPPHDTTRVDEGHRGTPQGHTIALSQPVERAVTWLVHHDDRRLRYRGTIANDAWLHARAAALNLRRLINLGLTHTGRTWRLTPAST